ncbi:MAG: metallophosphoesterase [Clostridia bacterium]|nr:metallophosphoesterase [Clostridia bacterium]
MKVLPKKSCRPFVILNLTDTHFDNEALDDTNIEQRILFHTVTELVNRTKPDLITITGDFAWTTKIRSYQRFTDFLDSFDIPWAPIFGNHDHSDNQEYLQTESGVHFAKETEDLLRIWKNSKNCLFESGAPEIGIGNYIIRIEENGKPIHALFMTDSQYYRPIIDAHGQLVINADGTPMLCMNDMSPLQSKWYSDAVDAWIAEGGKSSSILMHVPFKIHRDSFYKALAEGVDPMSVSTDEALQKDCWKPEYAESIGVVHEDIDGPEDECGIFDTIVEKNNTKLLLAGHDHLNNTIIRYRGVTVAFALKTGCAAYWDPTLNGGTTITINSNGSIQVKHHYVKADV